LFVEWEANLLRHLAMLADDFNLRKGREFAAWVGLVPREHSTGGKQKLLGISKRGNWYLSKGRSDAGRIPRFLGVFDSQKLPQTSTRYKLIRSVLAVYAMNRSSCVLIDSRRRHRREIW
jgi:hypothetical protein